MTNPNGAKGTKYESLLVNTANDFDSSLHLYRPAKAGALDHGDIHGADPFTIQAKDWGTITAALNEGLTGAVKQSRVNGTDYGVAVIKRRSKSVGESYAVLRYEDFIRVLLRLRRAESFEYDGIELTLANEADLGRPFPLRKAS